jgi:hypothetical protein
MVFIPLSSAITQGGRNRQGNQPGKLLCHCSLFSRLIGSHQEILCILTWLIVRSSDGRVAEAVTAIMSGCPLKSSLCANT